MGIAITPEQRELAEAVHGWIARAVPPEEVRKLLDAPGTGSPPFWDALAAQGLLAVHLPEEYGGGGGDLLDLAVVVEEAARAALPGPFLAHVLAAAVLASAASASAVPASTAPTAGDSPGPGDRGAGGLGVILRDLGSGNRVGAVAFGAGSLTAEAVDGGGYLLDGVAPPVLSGADADVLVLVASVVTGGPARRPGAAALQGASRAAPESAGVIRAAAEGPGVIRGAAEGPRRGAGPSVWSSTPGISSYGRTRAPIPRGGPPRCAPRGSGSAPTGCSRRARRRSGTSPPSSSPPTPAAPPRGHWTPRPGTPGSANSSAAPSDGSRA